MRPVVTPVIIVDVSVRAQIHLLSVSSYMVSFLWLNFILSAQNYKMFF